MRFILPTIIFILLSDIGSGQTIYAFDTLGIKGKTVLCDEAFLAIVLDSVSQNYIPTQLDINDAEILLNSTFLTAKINKIFGKGIWLNDYSQQCLAAINTSGHVVIWINCFCDHPDPGKLNIPFIVFDGGNCYFQAVIDLTDKKMISFNVNGDA